MIEEIHESWKPFFFNLIEKDFFREIDLLDPETIYPQKENIFRVFEMPIDDIKVIIIGQDPYPQPNQAVGLAFAVPARQKKPPSLRIIEEEVGHEVDRTMIKWSEQGVFLLNTALTVKRGVSGSHINLWRPFTAKLIQYISEHHPTIWLMWGLFAQEHIPIISNHVYQYRMDNEEDKNVVLIAPHPAAEVYRPGAGFIGCGHFKQVNEILKKDNKQLINW